MRVFLRPNLSKHCLGFPWDRRLGGPGCYEEVAESQPTKVAEPSYRSELFPGTKYRGGLAGSLMQLSCSTQERSGQAFLGADTTGISGLDGLLLRAVSLVVSGDVR